MNNIAFPGLGLSFEIDRVAFSIGIRDIYWYGIIIATGLILGVLFCSAEGKRVGLPKDTVIDLALIGTPCAIIGARAYFVLFNWPDYKDNLAGIFKIHEGGIAIYGAIIVAVIVGIIYCRVKKINFWQIADVAAFGFLIGQAIGRWGNFVNIEAYGIETTLPWRMEIYASELGRVASVHPTFLYESLWNTVAFFALLFYRKRKKFEGEIFLLYVAWYGIGRAWIEQLRVDSLPYSGSFKISQIVAIVTAIVAVGIIVFIRKKLKKTGAKNLEN